MLEAINERVSTKLLGLVAAIGIGVASLSIQTACIWFFNQPKVPEKLRK